MSNPRRLPPSQLRLIALMAESKDLLNKTGANGNDATRKGSENLCNLIVTTVHADNKLRDIIVDTAFNEESGSILLILNTSARKEQLLHLASVLNSISEIERMSYSSRKSEDGTISRIVKIQGESAPVADGYDSLNNQGVQNTL